MPVVDKHDFAYQYSESMLAAVAAAAQATPWWQGVLQGVAGGLISLVGVLITLSATGKRENQRERTRLEADAAKDEIQYRRARADRLRDVRVQLFTEVSHNIQVWARLVEPINIDELDGDILLPVKEAQSAFDEADKLDARMRLLGHDDMARCWSVYMRTTRTMLEMMRAANHDEDLDRNLSLHRQLLIGSRNALARSSKELALALRSAVVRNDME